MSRYAQKSKRDDSEPAIVKALEQVGCEVEPIDGKPFDLLVLRAGKVFLLEVKSSLAAARAKTPPNKRQANFRRRGWPVHVVLSPLDALRAVGLSSPRDAAERMGAAARARIDEHLRALADEDARALLEVVP